jgi:hypothetical protein
MIGQAIRVVLLVLAACTASAQPATDLDEFMSRTLARRDDNWRKLQQYVLDERERALLLGPGNVRLFGTDRQFIWYIREGERRKYEDEWLTRQRERDKKDADRVTAPAAEAFAGEGDVVQRLVREPQFVSAAYFLKFKFEPGRYAFAGSDTYEGQRVLKIEYYPTKLFSDDDKEGTTQPDAGDERRGARTDEEKARERELEDRLDRQFNKVALVTLWIEPTAHQIVKYEFQNIGLDFMPGRSLVRVDDVMAAMEMGQPFPGVWLPRRIDGTGAVTLASGTFALRFDIEYSDYREAATGARIR